MISKTTFIYLFMFSLYALHQCTYMFLHMLSIAFFSINLEKFEPVERLTLILRRGKSHIWILSPGIQIKPKAWSHIYIITRWSVMKYFRTRITSLLEIHLPLNHHLVVASIPIVSLFFVIVNDWQMCSYTIGCWRNREFEQDNSSSKMCPLHLLWSELLVL